MFSPKKILLVQLYSNGDCLYATTIAKQAKTDYRDCTIQWLVFPSIAPILQNNPYINEIIILEKITGETNDHTFSRAKLFAENHIRSGKADMYIFTQLLSDNFYNYDGCLRRSMFRFYPKPIMVDKRTIIELTDLEKKRAVSFAKENFLSGYTTVILFEASPMSGQANLNDEDIKNIAISLAGLKKTCVIISSFKSFDVAHPHVFDGSILSIRETVALSHSCTIVLGCSSGISWGCLSSAGKILPMVQMLNPNAYIYNPPSIDFVESDHDINQVIELFEFTPQTVTEIFSTIANKGFAEAKKLSNQVIKNKFMLHRGIVHDFLKRKKFSLLLRFVNINIRQNGWNRNMLIKMLAGFILFPIQYLLDVQKQK